MKGYIFTNAYYSCAGDEYKCKRLADELSLLGIATEHIVSDSVPAYVDGERAVSRLGACDFILYFDKDIHIARQLEAAGYRLFNSADAVAVCDDKMATHIALLNSGIKMPKTISSPLCYVNSTKNDFLKSVSAILSFPMIVKETHGSYGKQVHLVTDETELRSLYSELIMRPHLYQEFIEESSGRDLRVVVVGGKAVAWMKRESDDFRSNVELGGKGSVCDLPDDFRAAAEKAAAVLGLDYAGVDLLFGKDGPVLCEVNSNAHFGEMERVTGVNVAAAYARYIKNKLKSKF